MLPLAILLGGAAGAEPRCDVAMSQTAYIENESVRIATLRYSNLSESPLPVRLRLQLALPIGLVVDVLDVGATGSLVMPPGFDRILSPINMFPVSTQPRGTYEIRCALEDPVTHAVLVEDTASFDLPQFPDRYPVLLDYAFDPASPDATFNPMGIVLYEEFGPQTQVVTAAHCADWTADASVILSRERDEATFQHIDVETPGCAPTVVADAISLGPLGSLPYSVSLTSASLHYQPFGVATGPDGSFAADQPATFRLVGTVQIQGQTIPFDVLAQAIEDVAGVERPSGAFAPVDGSDDIALNELSIRALTVSVPGNRAPAIFSALVNGVETALRIGGFYAGTLGSGVATPLPVP
jgi:hypothetical protein